MALYPESNGWIDLGWVLGKRIRGIIMSYFDKKHTGGSNASIGFSYQDLCSLIYLFKNAADPEFNSLTIETINDFSILKKDMEVSVQVKNKSFRLQDARKLLQEYGLVEKKEYVFIGIGIEKRLENLLLKKRQLQNLLLSDRENNEKDKYVEDFKKELKIINMEPLFDKIMVSDFISIPQSDAEIYLYYHLSVWLDKINYSLNKELFINELLVTVSKLRATRGFINKKTILELAKKYSIDSIAKTYIEQTILILQKPPEILKMLGETTNDIVNPISEKLRIAENEITKGNYKEALEVYTSLANIYQNEFVYLQCAMLYDEIGETIRAFEYCDKVLKLNDSVYEAYYIKGTCLCEQRKYDEAIFNYKKALEIKESYELYYNLGYTFWLKQDRESSVVYYKKSLKLNDSNSSAHLNLSISYFELQELHKALDHIDKALSLEPLMFQALARKGELLRYVGIYDEATIYFEKCLEQDKDNYMALYGLFLCLCEQGKMDHGLVYLARLLSVYKDTFFKEGKKSILVIDAGWYRTLYFKLELIGNDQVLIDLLGMQVIINMSVSKDYIFIGLDILKDDNTQMFYPFLGKVFETKNYYTQTVDEILKRVHLIQFFDKPIYIDINNEIETYIQELEDNVFIKISFGDFVISGYTSSKGKEGYFGFKDYYDEYGQYKVVIGCKETKEQFIIEALSKLEVG